MQTLRWFACTATCLALTAAAAADAPKAAGAATPVSVVKAERGDFPVQLVLSGTVVSPESVDLRAQTTSVVRQVHVKEGDFVRAGQLLFSLDERADAARLAQARGQQARDAAQQADAQRQLDRARELVAQNFLSQSAVDTAAAQLQTLQATVQADAAAVQAAQVQLGFNQLRAPFAGRIGAINAQPGALVQASGTAAPLLTLTRMDPMLVSFSVPEVQLQGLLAQQARAPVAVTAQAAGAAQAAQGQLIFIDNAVDASSGGVRAKARFANPQQALWPGQSARVVLTPKALQGVVSLPLTALIDGSRGLIVYVLQADGTVKPQPVKVLAQDERRAVVDGLQGGEQVVMEGKQNLRPGAKVVVAKASTAANAATAR